MGQSSEWGSATLGGTKWRRVPRCVAPPIIAPTRDVYTITKSTRHLRASVPVVCRHAAQSVTIDTPASSGGNSDSTLRRAMRAVGIRHDSRSPRGTRSVRSAFLPSADHCHRLGSAGFNSSSGRRPACSTGTFPRQWGAQHAPLSGHIDLLAPLAVWSTGRPARRVEATSRNCVDGARATAHAGALAGVDRRAL